MRLLVGLLVFAQTALAGPPEIRPLPFTPRAVSVKTGAPTLTNVLLVSVQVAAANPNRRGFIIFNNSSNSGYCCLAATCTSAACTRLIATFTSWEPQQPLIYQGAISCIRNAGNGNMVVWEFE